MASAVLVVMGVSVAFGLAIGIVIGIYIGRRSRGRQDQKGFDVVRK